MDEHCSRHPERPSVIKCHKMERAFCQQCLDECEACTDPCTYCKFRPQCVIWELCRKSEKRYQREREIKGEV